MQRKQIQGEQIQGKQRQDKQIQGEQIQDKQIQDKQIQDKQIQDKQIQGKQRQSTQTQRLTKSEIFTQTLKCNIQEGTYPYGTALPAERELAESFGLNRSTVRAAIQTLVEEGLLKKVQGKGTFVMRHARDNAYTHFRGMSELLKNHGYVPSSRILYTGPTPAGYKLSHLLQVDEDTVLYRIMRLRLGNGLPVSIENTFVPYELIPDIEDIDFQIYSLYDAFAMNSLHIAGIQQVFSTTRVRNSEAKYLNAENGSPVVSIAITSASEENGIIEYTNALVLPEFCKFYSDGVIQDSKLNVYAQSI